MKKSDRVVIVVKYKNNTVPTALTGMTYGEITTGWFRDELKTFLEREDVASVKIKKEK